MLPAREMIGLRFGLLQVTAVATSRTKTSRCVVLCDCGVSKIVSASNLRSGATRSCGCLHRAGITALNLRHGRTRGGREHYHPLYKVWEGMIARCGNRNFRGYANYGGRGIVVCERWRHDFAAFLADMGERPSPRHSIDRRKNDGPYDPSNCHWATKTEQQRNRRDNRMLTHNGETLCIATWADRVGIRARIIYDRLSAGWSVERSLTELPRLPRTTRLAAGAAR